MNAPTVAGQLDRRAYLGSSDIAAVIGLGAYGRTAYSCYCDKIGESFTEMDDSDRRFLERRKRWEGPIVEMLREEFNGEIVAVNQRYIDPEYDFMAAEIDAEWVDSAGGTQNIEIKTVSPFAYGERHGWGEPGTADIPVHYAAQCMFGLMVTGRQTCIVAAMVGLDNMIFYQIDRDEETISAMRAEAVRFWHENVLARDPPPPQTMRDLRVAMDRLKGCPVELQTELRDKLEQLRAVRERIKAMAGEEEALAFEVGDYVRQQWSRPDAEPGDAVLLFGGQKIATWKRQRGAHLDQKRLKAEHPDIIEQYTKEHWYRVLRLSKPKGA